MLESKSKLGPGPELPGVIIIGFIFDFWTLCNHACSVVDLGQTMIRKLSATAKYTEIVASLKQRVLVQFCL